MEAEFPKALLGLGIKAATLSHLISADYLGAEQQRATKKPHS